MNERKRTLRSITHRYATARGNLYINVVLDSNDKPYEVFGWMGKGGSFERGIIELVCRLVSLHLRRNTNIEDVIHQCRDIGEMQPFANKMDDDNVVMIKGLGDALVHALSLEYK